MLRQQEWLCRRSGKKIRQQVKGVCSPSHRARTTLSKKVFRMYRLQAPGTHAQAPRGGDHDVRPRGQRARLRLHVHAADDHRVLIRHPSLFSDAPPHEKPIMLGP